MIRLTRIRTALFAIALISWSTMASAQDMSADAAQESVASKKFTLGTSMFSILNFFPDSSEFYQLNLGYQLTEVDTLLLEAMTWLYRSPNGIPKSPDNKPTFDGGYVRTYGLSFAYQRFIWERAFVRLHVTPFLHEFVGADKKLIQRGFFLMTQARLGYEVNFSLWGQDFYLDPSVGFEYWPIDTNVPSSFAAAESHYTNFALSPGLSLGFRF